jgi:hypothetical protein
MPRYRLYTVGSDGEINGPPEVVQCADEQEAIGEALQAVNGKKAELWDGERLVARLPVRSAC